MHVRGLIWTAAHQRHDVIDHIAGASSGSAAGAGARVRTLESQLGRVTAMLFCVGGWNQQKQRDQQMV
ncbi:MAG: hypothetical protein JST28_09025 [Acidobacteria bacterium]|nr:hypothetical protein [Acidobacteriota bacterium]